MSQRFIDVAPGVGVWVEVQSNGDVHNIHVNFQGIVRDQRVKTNQPDGFILSTAQDAYHAWKEAQKKVVK